jgi:hypothetical protein
LRTLGVEAVPVVWDDPCVDWDAYALSVLRSTWDYPSRREEFVAWAYTVPRLANSAPVVEWNTDKHYLADLEDRGVPVVPTIWLEPHEHLGSRGLHTRFPAMGDFVVKPAVAAGSIGAGRYTANSGRMRGLAITHARSLLEAGQAAMVQRYVPSVDSKGETSLIFLDGGYAYAVRKAAMLHGPVDQSDRMYQEETLEGGYQPCAQELEVAQQAIDAALEIMGNPMRPFLYARADLVQGDDGKATLLELELTEPSLFPELAPGGIDQVCRAIAGRLSPV